ncbi:MAG: SdrD B-like domain-containing protein, partial [Clostridium sp.]
NDVPTNGFKDPSQNGLTGSWNGNTLTFNLPKYAGARYDVTFKAKVIDTINPGQLFNNIGKWSTNGEERNEAQVQLVVFDPNVGQMEFYKYGTRTTVVGGPITYQVVNINIGQIDLNNYILEDFVPLEVDITKLRVTSNSGLENYKVSISLRTNPNNYITVVPNILLGGTPLIDLTPFIPLGDGVSRIRIEAQVFRASTGHELQIFGETNNKAVVGTSFINNAKASSGELIKEASWKTDVNGASDLAASKSISPQKLAYFPLDELKFSISGSALNTITINPILSDLMPNGLIYIKDSEYYLYDDFVTGKVYDSRNSSFPVPLPTREIIQDFGGTGQTLLRWSFNNFILPINNSITVVFTVLVAINPPLSFINKAYEGNPGNNILFVQNEVQDTLDFDGDGLTTTDKISGVELLGALLTTSEFSIFKRVKGEKDLDFSSSGITIDGGNIEYNLMVTNNQSINLQDIELVDILPYVDDKGVILVNEARGSQFEVYATSTVTAKIINVLGDPVIPQDPEIIIEYSKSNNPVRFDELGNQIGTGTWSMTPPENITTLRSIKVTTGPNVILKPYERLIVTIGAKAPVGAPINKPAYNSFAVRANKLLLDGVEPMLPTEPPKIPVVVLSEVGASIGNFVWEDYNGNGLYDQDEPGINGVRVELYDENGIIINSTLTSNDANGKPGYYLFAGLNEGVYQVKFIPFGGFNLTKRQEAELNGSKPDPTTGFTSFINLSANQERLDIDAGLITDYKGVIGDFVWEDLNGNGLYDPNEPGVNGVRVELYDNAYVLLKVAITNNDINGNPGYYLFTDLAPGQYLVKFIPPNDYILTQQKDTEPNGSKPDPVTGYTNIIDFPVNGEILDIDAGVMVICKPPVINASNKCIYVGEPFNPLEGVTATGCKERDLTSLIVVESNNVDNTKPGIYTVIYEVTDDLSGVKTIKRIYVRVVEKGPYFNAVTDLVESIALQVASLAHILNAESEKVERAKAIGATKEELLKVNNSVNNMVDSVTMLELVLQGKLDVVKCGVCFTCTLPEEN